MRRIRHEIQDVSGEEEVHFRKDNNRDFSMTDPEDALLIAKATG